MKRRETMAFVRALLGVVLVAPVARGALGPDDLLVIYNSASRESEDLAFHYAARRQVAAERLLGLALPQREVITREEYEALAAKVREYLWSRGLAQQVRCLVTMYDVPLVVARRPMSEQERRQAEALRQYYRLGVQRFRQVTQNLEDIMAGRELRPVEPLKGGHPTPQELLREYRAIQRRALEQAESLGDTPEGKQFTETILQQMEQVDGKDGLLNVLLSMTDPEAREARQQILDRRAKLAHLRAEAERAVETDALSPDYLKAMETVWKVRGGAQVLQRVLNDLERITALDSEAAVDSELALLWWEPYKLEGAVSNLLNPEIRKIREDTLYSSGRPEIFERPKAQRPPGTRPILMVSRLDGPSPEVVRRMIDDAVEAEEAGLRGRVYIDRDPSRASDEGGYFEGHMALLASALRNLESAGLEVVEDTSPKVLPADSGKDAVMYVGWYLPRQYNRPVRLRRGAVAWHIGEDEARGLHDAGERGWCAGLLRDGAAATVGQIGGRSVALLPSPRTLIPLLLTGEYSLAEAYWLSVPRASTMTVLLGDPLYRPFKGRGLLEVEQIYSEDYHPVELAWQDWEPIPRNESERLEPPKRRRERRGHRH